MTGWAVRIIVRVRRSLTETIEVPEAVFLALIASALGHALIGLAGLL